MNQDAKKTSRKEKKQRKKARDETIKKANDLWEKEKYQECLGYIDSLGDEGLKILQVFSIKVFVLVQLKQHEEVLALQKRQEEFGHEKTLPCGVWFIYAYCNRKKNCLLEAYSLYRYVHDHNDVDDGILKKCVKWIKRLQPKVQPELDKVALERASRFLDDVAASSSAVVAPSSAVVASSSDVAAPLSAVAAPPSAVAAPPSAVAAPPPSAVAASSLSVAASPPSAVAASSLSVAASPQNVMKFTDGGTICFEMVKLDENSCLGIMKSSGGSFPKSYIKLLENSTSEISINLKKNPCLLKIEFSLYSPSLSCMVAIVEPVHPIKAFFELKFESFKTTRVAQTREKWWEYIKDDFRTIFRGIICGMFAIYSEQEVCSDLEKSMYVTKEGEGKIFHVSGEKFTYTKAQREVDDLLSTMESVITLVRPRRRPDLQTWLLEFEISYKLPEELCHFLRSLRVKKIQCDKIQPTWLINHPYIWSVHHRISFFDILDDVMRERLIDEYKFSAHLSVNFNIVDWNTRALNDKLLEAIYNFKGDSYYAQSVSRVLNFIHAIFSHSNDYAYDLERGHKSLTPEEKETLVTKVFPSIYTILYDAVCSYAQHDNQHTFAEFAETTVRRHCKYNCY